MPSAEPDETTIPAFTCVSLDETLDFYRTLGFEVTYEQYKPYQWGSVRRGGIELTFYGDKKMDPLQAGSCIVMVRDAEPYHVGFTAALRAKYGRVPASGLPRITRFRKGQTRFSVFDPSGNSVAYISREEPDQLEYGGSRELSGLARAIDNSRIFRDFKDDDRVAAQVLDVALARYHEEAPTIDRARALAARLQLAIALNDGERAQTVRDELGSLDLSDAERILLSAEPAAEGQEERTPDG